MHIATANFEMMYPDEWEAACQAWNTHNDNLQQAEWERARWMATRILQPYARKALRPTDLGRFPWENTPRETPPTLTKEQQLQRMEAAIQKFGRTY